MEKTKKILHLCLHILDNRLLFLFGLCLAAFVFISNVLFEIQIIEGQHHFENTSTRVPRQILLPPERGHIYDRFGRPLAVNLPTHSVLFDPSVSLPQAELNRIMLNLLELLERNGELFFDVLPMTSEAPFDFVFGGSNPEGQRARFFADIDVADEMTVTQFRGNQPALITQPLSVEAFFERMVEQFQLADLIEEKNLDSLQIRNLISLRLNLFHHRFRRFEPITISLDVGTDTIISIEEDPVSYGAAFISTEFLRYYPHGRYFSHIVGYTGNIRDVHDIEALLADGYTLTDQIGQTGMELSFESELRGRPGQETIYTNLMGRRLGTVANSRVEPVHGADVFLTLDRYLQIEAFHILESTLTNAIIGRLMSNQSGLPNSQAALNNLTVQDALASLIGANNIDPRLLWDAEPGTVSYQLKNWVHLNDEKASVATRAERNQVNRLLASGITDGHISPNQAIVLLYEQGIIPGGVGFTQRALGGGVLNARNIFSDALRQGFITPQMTNVDPSTGSLVLVDVWTGEVLAAVSYPSFDNNELVNNMNNAYFNRLLDDPTSPMVNRAFMERIPPGSVFKMLTGIAGMEYGVITPTSTIHDRPVFERAGYPYPTSWSARSLGNLNVSQAIAISSNYFFYETSFRLGQFGEGYARLASIDRMNTYMRAFGFNDRTGVEIGESFRGAALQYQMASPELQEFLAITDPNLRRDWSMGDTVRTAIGQHINAYTAATMARFTAGLATRGQVVDLRLLDRVVADGNTYMARTIPLVHDLDIADTTWNAVHDGMLWVTRPSLIRPWNSGSTLSANVFGGFPFGVGAKTGTAEHGIGNRLSHTTFNAFAPFEEPQVAIYVSIPFGNLNGTTLNLAPTIGSSLSSHVARDVLMAYFDLAPPPVDDEAPTDTLLQIR